MQAQWNELLAFGFPRKIFFLEFQSVPSFLKNIFMHIGLTQPNTKSCAEVRNIGH